MKTNEIRNNKTELVFILDRSGSMANLVDDTIGGFNSTIEKQKEQEGETFVTTILFDDKVETLHDRIELQQVEPMSRKTYFVRGCTALFDAVGYAVEHIAMIHKYARPEDVPQNTMFVIITDGMENASRQYDRHRVKQMIEHEKEKYGWEFIFIGANIDAAETAESFGIGRECAANYVADSVGTQVVYDAVCCNISNVRACQPMASNWKENIDADFAKRSGRGFFGKKQK